MTSLTKAELLQTRWAVLADAQRIRTEMGKVPLTSETAKEIYTSTLQRLDTIADKLVVMMTEAPY